jgi:hypothetical protein
MVYEIIVISRWGAHRLTYHDLLTYLGEYKRLLEDGPADVILQGNTYPVGGTK